MFITVGSRAYRWRVGELQNEVESDLDVWSTLPQPDSKDW